MVRIDVPATTANLGPGFDTLGLALQLYNTVEMEETDGEFSFVIEGEGQDSLPIDEGNIILKAANLVFERVGYQPKGLRVKAVNRIPLARGLGSSAAAIMGGIMAANLIAKANLSDRIMLDWAVELEGHPDNLTPAFAGGLTVSVVGEQGVNWIKADFPEQVRTVVVVPEFELSTQKARAALPKEVSMEDAVYNVSRSSLLVAAIMSGKVNLLSEIMDDRLHQPYRTPLIPGLQEVFAAAKEAGAASAAISGSGPTVIAFLNEGADAEKIGLAMEGAFLSNNVKSHAMVLSICPWGAQVK